MERQVSACATGSASSISNQSQRNRPIDDKRIATALNDMILSMGAQPDRSLRQVDEACLRHESVACRKFVSPLRPTMLPDIMNPLSARHPDPKPPAPA